MPLKCYDSTTPADIPNDAPMVAPYLTGSGAWPAAQIARFASRPMVTISQMPGVMVGHVCDVEARAWLPDQVAEYVRHRKAAGVTGVGVYAARDSWPAIEHATIGLTYFRWLADPTGVPHQVPGFDAVQYAWPPASGGHYDLSEFYSEEWIRQVTPPAGLSQHQVELLREAAQAVSQGAVLINQALNLGA